LNSRTNLILHYPDTPTYHHNTRTNSTLDFFIANTLVPVSYIQTKMELNSDHFPVLCTINQQINKLNPSTKSYNFKYANWPFYQKLLDKKFETFIINEDDDESMNKQIQTNII